ncbi:Zinc/iron permease [Powellomyces hirtus]|nr:Zinc/iron permease [Powellomyces hirtus]
MTAANHSTSPFVSKGSPPLVRNSAFLLSTASIALSTAVGAGFVLVLPAALLNAFNRPMLALTVGFILGDIVLDTVPMFFGDNVGVDRGFAACALLGGILLPTLLEYATDSAHDPEHHPEDSHREVKSDGLHQLRQRPVPTGDARTPESSSLKKRRIVSSASLSQLLQDPRARAYAVQKCCHCLADGMTLYISFLSSFQHGLSATMALLLHEIPHKIADYTFLRSRGFCISEITKLQVFGFGGAAIGAALGATFFHLAQMPLSSMDPPLLDAFAAGGLLHMVCSAGLPDLLNERDGTDMVKRLGLVGVGAVLAAIH